MPSTVKIKAQQSNDCLVILTLLLVFFASVLKISYCSENNGLITVEKRGEPALGKSFELICKTVGNSTVKRIWWSGPDEIKTEKDKPVILSFPSLNINNISNYTCHADFGGGKQVTLPFSLTFNVGHKIKTSVPGPEKRGGNISMTCTVTGYPLDGEIWWTFRDRKLSNTSSTTISTVQISATRRDSTVTITNLTEDHHNGTYHCHYSIDSVPVHVKVLSEPTVKFAVIKALGTSSIFVNWTLHDGNSPVKIITLGYKQAGQVSQTDVTNSTRYILIGLKAGTPYTDFEITATNDVGEGKDKSLDTVETLPEDPVFVPEVMVTGSTMDSVTMNVPGFNKVSEFYHFFNVSVKSEDGLEVASRIERENPFMITSLEPGKNYSFEVQACSDYTGICGKSSQPKYAKTMDGLPSAPRSLVVNCTYDERSGGLIRVAWQTPEHKRGTIEEYLITLRREAIFTDGNGQQQSFSSNAAKTVKSDTMTFEFRNEPANTNFTVSVCAKTRLKTCGDPHLAYCATPEVPPGVEELNHASWRPSPDTGRKRVVFLVTVPRISQRNGSICCIRIVVVKLQKGQQDISTLSKPGQIALKTYEEVHNSSATGAYIAEVFNASNLRHLISQKALKVIVGDEEYNKDGEDKGSICRHCWSLPDSGNDLGYSGEYRRASAYPQVAADFRKHKKRHAGLPPNPPVRDGPLNVENMYTAYLDAIIVTREASEPKVKAAHSDYFNALSAKFVEEAPASPFNQIFQPKNLAMLVVGSMVVTLMIIFMALICVMRWRRKEPGDQEYGLSHSIHQFCMRLRGQELIPHEMPDQPPIPKDMLVAAYQERHDNNDAGFQKEFSELPERFRDRTTEASAKNVAKNRYPDIRAYDQTRVKLSTVDGGSDYINANFVVGYKERKKFICAQGPMESTVVDWWRMIWEQRVHLLIMLTNIEEYSKTKCAKYWPSEGSSEYGNITVTHSSEKRYSDYLVRSLKLRLNGPDGDTVKEERDIEQYHYLVWKDYMAPEHPVGIIRFIKRINEVYAIEKGPILVHCSAGVGRTGTLVALDSLLQQLNEEGCVSILNTICDLRHQRNYLVQSLKQYIFIYRALMEAALFGDTEVPVPDLKSHIERLKVIPEGKNVTRLQEEFERLSQVIEDRKPFVTGSSEENRHRNRHENVIPYDRNRVHLSPMPGLNKEICTYINASFIEGYDSSEQYIIAQDPLESTVGDFWRMIVEHNIRSVVMLSEVGDDKCPRYWPEKDQETSHDYIRVKYMQSQSFPFYYRREFTVTNTKAEDSCLVTQFQYNGWPVGETAVPESSRGMVELIDTTFKHRETLDKCNGPTLIHCSAGADRSCIFVALAILVRQMMNESRVDVFSVVRKLRSQRQGLFQNMAQYEFVYRGLDTYADLHVANGNASH